MGDFGLNQVFEYTELCLDSWDATTQGNSDGPLAKYSWPLYYYTTRSEDVAAIKVLQAEIPFVFDTINSNNNVFTFIQSAINYPITIPPGTYNGPDMATLLTTLLSAISGGFTVTWNASTMKFTFTHAGAGTWGLLFADRNTPYSNLGFIPGTTYSASGSGSTIVSATVAAVSGPYYLYINSRKLGPFVNFNLSDGSPTGGDFPGLCRVPINANYGEVIFYNDPDPSKYFDLFLGREFDSFDFFLTLGSDQSQVPLDMKGSPWSIKLAILSYRKATDDIYEKPRAGGTKVIRM
jgi:hypothetical protein